MLQIVLKGPVGRDFRPLLLRTPQPCHDLFFPNIHFYIEHESTMSEMSVMQPRKYP